MCFIVRCIQQKRRSNKCVRKWETWKDEGNEKRRQTFLPFLDSHLPPPSTIHFIWSSAIFISIAPISTSYDWLTVRRKYRYRLFPQTFQSESMLTMVLEFECFPYANVKNNYFIEQVDVLQETHLLQSPLWMKFVQLCGHEEWSLSNCLCLNVTYEDFNFRKLKAHSKYCKMNLKSWDLRPKLNEAHAISNHTPCTMYVIKFSVAQPCEGLCRLESRRELTPSFGMVLFDFDNGNQSILLPTTSLQSCFHSRSFHCSTARLCGNFSIPSEKTRAYK